MLCLDLERNAPDSPTHDSPRFCGLQPATAISNTSGVATFDQVMLQSANSQFVELYVLYESGYTPLLVAGRRTLTVLSNVHAVLVQGAANLSATERVPIDRLPTVTVVDEHGRPMANRVVFAVIVQGPVSPCPLFASDDLSTSYLPRKALLSSISMPTDASGVAR